MIIVDERSQKRKLHNNNNSVVVVVVVVPVYAWIGNERQLEIGACTSVNVYFFLEKIDKLWRRSDEHERIDGDLMIIPAKGYLIEDEERN